MGIFSWIVLGLVAGILAKWIMPGPDPGGIILTILLGIAGAAVGGMIAASLGYGAMSGFDIRGLMVAVGGALLLIIGYRLIANRQLT